VSQAYRFVETGNAEVGLVSHSNVGAKGVKAFRVDRSLYAPIVQALGVVAASKRKDDARAFAKFMTSETGMGIMAEFGFSKPAVASDASADPKPKTDSAPPSRGTQ
jgi:molybdate transport system substrate-binding protein